MKETQKSLKRWTKQKWRTKSGKPSTQGKDATGERYLPEKKIKSMTDKAYASLTRHKQDKLRKGIQHAKGHPKYPKGLA
jgi:hypothetical protein